MAALLLPVFGQVGEWKQAKGYRSRPLTVAGKQDGFTLLHPADTGMAFTNVLSLEEAAGNEILLNGSGVALGDVDNDGLCDIYLCRLSGASALYRNKGKFTFEDITISAGVACTNQYSTSATLADLDRDGDLDLLVGSVQGGLRTFMNGGKGKFQETTDVAGVRSRYTSSSIALADVDGDGDLDVYHCTYRGSTIRNRDIKFKTVNGRRIIDAPNPDDYEFTKQGTLLEHAEPDQLFINDGKGLFTASSWTSGRFLDEDGKPLKQAHKDWGLSVQFRDMNRDGAPDIYVCNDFFSPDRIWINDGKGNFRLINKFAIRHTSSFSMGVDFADVNRDGFYDFFVTDMLSRSHSRRITQSVMAGPGLPDQKDRPQVSHNTLFLNRGDNTYSEIAFLGGVQASDWSWATIFMDVDLDGFEDLLVTTGHYYDSQDADAENKITGLPRKPSHVERLKYYPKLNVPNYAFRNGRDLTFEEVGAEWGFNFEGVSHGMALGDLDGDGDLDLVVNNLNAAAGIYRNNSVRPRIAVHLHGGGIGSRLVLKGEGLEQSQEMISGGRYLSGDEQLRVFAAVGTKLEVTWRNGKKSEIAVEPNHLYEVSDGEAVEVAAPPAKRTMFKELKTEFIPDEQAVFSDWDRQPILPRALSRKGPVMLVDDFNKDDFPDLLYGTGRGELHLYYNKAGTEFTLTNTTPAPAGLRDIVGLSRLVELAAVTYSSYETTGQGGALMTYQLVSNSLRRISALALTNSEPSALASADVDGNGDADLFLGQFAPPGKYPIAGDSRLFLNRKGDFFYATNFPKGLGLVNAAHFADLDGDKDEDLLIASDLSPIRILINQGSNFTDNTTNLGMHVWTGFWSCLATADFNQDGKMDFVAGNFGRNTPYSKEVTYHFGDWAENGSVGILESVEGWPLSGPDVLAKALPGLGDRFGSYSNYARARTAEILKGFPSRTLTVNTFETSVFLNTGKGFERKALPIEAQFAPVNSISVADFDGDGKLDLYLAQNLFTWRDEFTRSDAGRGLILLGDARGGFTAKLLSGIEIYGEQRASAAADFNGDGNPDVAVTQTDGPIKIYLNQR